LNLVHKALADVRNWVKSRSVGGRSSYEGKARLSAESQIGVTDVDQRPHRGCYLRRST
jgi:hypothetical protein